MLVFVLKEGSVFSAFQTFLAFHTTVFFSLQSKTNFSVLFLCKKKLLKINLKSNATEIVMIITIREEKERILQMKMSRKSSAHFLLHFVRGQKTWPVFLPATLQLQAKI